MRAHLSQFIICIVQGLLCPYQPNLQVYKTFLGLAFFFKHSLGKLSTKNVKHGLLVRVRERDLRGTKRAGFQIRTFFAQFSTFSGDFFAQFWALGMVITCLPKARDGHHMSAQALGLLGVGPSGPHPTVVYFLLEEYHPWVGGSPSMRYYLTIHGSCHLAYAQFCTFFAQNCTCFAQNRTFLSKIGFRLDQVKAGHTAGAHRGLCNAGNQRVPMQSRVAKSEPSGLNPTGLKVRQTCGDYSQPQADTWCEAGPIFGPILGRCMMHDP